MKSKEKIAYLGMIQEVISRMAGNALLLRGGTATLIYEIYLLATKNSSRIFMLISFLLFLNTGHLSTQKRPFVRYRRGHTY